MVADDPGAPSIHEGGLDRVQESGRKGPIAGPAADVAVGGPEVDLTVAGGQDADPGTPTQLRLRRAPRYRPFGLTGAFIGVVAGVVLALSFTAASNYSMQTIAGYFAAIFGLLGVVLGLGLAVLIERRHSERGHSTRGRSAQGRSERGESEPGRS